MADLDYGPVFVTKGRLKGRVLYYDDDATEKTAICYVGHPLHFVGTYSVHKRLLREPTIDDLLKRREEISRVLANIAIKREWLVDPREVHMLWSERTLVTEELYERRFLGEFGRLGEAPNIFLCHSSKDKGFVRMVHDDPKRLGAASWLDENEIDVGESIVEKISEALNDTKFLVLFLSESSVKSLWTTKEWQAFLSKQLTNGTAAVLPLLIEDCKIPGILADIKYADFRQSYHDGFKSLHRALVQSSKRAG